MWNGNGLQCSPNLWDNSNVYLWQNGLDPFCDWEQDVLVRHRVRDTSRARVLVPSQHRLLQNTTSWLSPECLFLHGSYISRQDLVGRHMLSTTSGTRDLWRHMTNFMVRTIRNNLPPDQKLLDCFVSGESTHDSVFLDGSDNVLQMRELGVCPLGNGPTVRVVGSTHSQSIEVEIREEKAVGVGGLAQGYYSRSDPRKLSHANVEMSNACGWAVPRASVDGQYSQRRSPDGGVCLGQECKDKMIRSLSTDIDSAVKLKKSLPLTRTQDVVHNNGTHRVVQSVATCDKTDMLHASWNSDSRHPSGDHAAFDSTGEVKGDLTPGSMPGSCQQVMEVLLRKQLCRGADSENLAVVPGGLTEVSLGTLGNAEALRLLEPLLGQCDSSTLCASPEQKLGTKLHPITSIRTKEEVVDSGMSIHHETLRPQIPFRE